MTTTTATRFTVAEFDRMIERGIFNSNGRERRIELIFGELREVNPPGPTHEEVVDRLNYWSMQHAPAAKVRKPTKWAKPFRRSPSPRSN